MAASHWLNYRPMRVAPAIFTKLYNNKKETDRV